jgi:hypothetical protein
VITGGIKSAHDVLTDDRLSREKAYAEDIATQHQVTAAVITSDTAKDNSTSSKAAASKRSRLDKVLSTNYRIVTHLHLQLLVLCL